MARIRKFQNPAGPIEDPQTPKKIKVKGLGEVNPEDLRANIR